MEKMLVVFILVLAFFLVFGCTQNESTSFENSINNNYEDFELSLQELEKHNNAKDCWLLINGKIYDVTSFVSSHPGGIIIAQGCGKDATEYFETRSMGSNTPHSQNARRLLEKYYIGDLVN